MYKIKLTKNGININNTRLIKYDIDSLKSIFGDYRLAEKDETDQEMKSGHKLIIWDNYGIYVYTDDLHTIISLDIQLGQDPAFAPKWDLKKWRPLNNFGGEININGNNIEKYTRKNIEEQYITLKCGNYKCYLEKYKNCNQFASIEIVYVKPKIATNKYIQKKIDGKILTFKNFNFKLAVIEELMFTKALIEPKFNVYDFAENYTKREIDIDSEGYEIIPEVKKYFQNLEINAELAEKIDELDLDGGNEIYLQLCPFWDGEDDLFTIKKIDENELKQFTKLKKITSTLLDENNKIKQVLKKYNIEIIH